MFHFQKVCVPPWRFRKILDFSTYCIFLWKFEKNGKKKRKKSRIFFVSAGGPEKQIFSKETLLLRGGRKGDPDTKSGLGKFENSFWKQFWKKLKNNSEHQTKRAEGPF